jgi:adenylosuccinate synthase
MGATVIVDAFWGDAGKGARCVAYAKRLAAAGNVRVGAGTNAGHTVYFQDGTRILSRMLPPDWPITKGPVRIGSGVCRPGYGTR